MLWVTSSRLGAIGSGPQIRSYALWVTGSGSDSGVEFRVECIYISRGVHKARVRGVFWFFRLPT